MATRQKKIEINWLRGFHSLADVRSTKQGIYIIYQAGLPIYVGQTRAGRGFSRRIRGDHLGCLLKMKVNPAPYKAKIGLMQFPITRQDLDLAERIVTRTLVKEPKGIVRLGNRGNEKSPLRLLSDVKLILKGYPPQDLTRKLDRLTKNRVITKVASFPSTYIIKKTRGTAKYESFTDSLTLPELRELEWV